MLAQEGGKYGFTIHWPANQRRRLRRIIETGRCPSKYRPQRVSGRVPVAVVDESGEVLLLFTLARIDWAPDRLREPFSCELVAVRGSVRRPGGRDHQKLPVQLYGEWQIAYFDPKTGERAIFDLTRGGAGALGDTSRELLFHTVLANNVGKTLSQPERELVACYRDWVGRPDILGHIYMRGPRAYTDLFIRPLYALVEAKSVVDRRTLRTALGQLFDYQRCFDRHPRLVLLVPKKPSRDMLDLFASKRVWVIWRSRGRSFADSVDGVFTTLLRLDE